MRFKWDNVYKVTLILDWTLQEVENMSQKNKAGQCSNCQTAAEPIVMAAEVSASVSTQKRKEEAKQILYLNRV